MPKNVLLFLVIYVKLYFIVYSSTVLGLGLVLVLLYSHTRFLKDFSSVEDINMMRVVFIPWLLSIISPGSTGINLLGIFRLNNWFLMKYYFAKGKIMGRNILYQPTFHNKNYASLTLIMEYIKEHQIIYQQHIWSWTEL